VQTLSELAPHTRRTFARCFDTAASVQQRARCLAWAFNHRISVWNPFEYYTFTKTIQQTSFFGQRRFKDSDSLDNYSIHGQRTARATLEEQIGLGLLQIVRQAKGQARAYSLDKDLQTAHTFAGQIWAPGGGINTDD
jgi:hypothetical protein